MYQIKVFKRSKIILVQSMQTENFFQLFPRVLSVLKYTQWFLVLQTAAHVEWTV